MKTTNFINILQTTNKRYTEKEELGFNNFSGINRQKFVFNWLVTLKINLTLQTY